MAEAFHIASSGRPGAVLVDIPKDVLQGQCTFSWPPQIDLPGYKPNTKPHSRQIREAAKLIAAARKPVLYVGGGVIRGEATEQLLDLAELTGIPVVTTLMARGAFPDSHPQNLGMPGMHGTVAAVAALQRSDLLIALGTRFDDRVTGTAGLLRARGQGDPRRHRPGRDRQEPQRRRADRRRRQSRHRRPASRRCASYETPGHARHDDWWAYLRRRAGDLPAELRTAERRQPEPGVRHRDSSARSPGPDAVYVAGVGQHQMWAAQFISYEKPRTWLNSGGLGTMGFAVPGGHGRQDRPPRRRGLGDRRRRLLPDDQPGAGHLRGRGRADQGGADQQRQPGHGAAVADACSTRSATARPTWPRTPTASPTSSSWPRRWDASDCVASVKKTSST